MAKKLNITPERFHLEVKRNILRQFKTEIKKELKTENPDIGLDKLDKVYLSSLDHKQIVYTGLSIFEFL